VTARDRSWSNQDAVATIKRQLQLLLPGSRVFLDVDDLASVERLEEYVGGSAAMLVFLGSPAYLASANCLRELAAATAHRVPLIRVHESDPVKNGAPIDALERMCPDEHRCNLFGHRTDGAQLGAMLGWHRTRDFQVACLAQIAEQTLLASPSYASEASLPLYMPGALAWASPAFASRTPIYTSCTDTRASAVAATLCDAHSLLERTDEPPTDAASATRWLLFLYVGCFDGEAGVQLADDMRAALGYGAVPVTVYAPAMGPFGAIIDATPQALREAGLFGPLAVEWHEGALTAVSMAQLALRMGAQLAAGCCEQWRWPNAVRACAAALASVCGNRRALERASDQLVSLSGFEIRRPSTRSMRSGRELAGADSARVCEVQLVSQKA
jgi:hypothetical protein